MSLAVRRLTAPQQLEEAAAEWEELDRRSSPRTPFSSYTWNTLWWKHFQSTTALRRDEFFVHLIRGNGGRLVAIAPLLKRYSPGYGPVHMRTIQFFGCDPSITEIRGIICAPADHAAAVQALIDHFRFCDRRWDLFLWSGIREGSHLAPGLEKLSMVKTHVVSDYLLRMPSAWTDLQSRVSSNTRKSFRKAAEFLQAGHHVCTFHAIADPAALDAAVPAFFRLHAARAQASAMTVKHPDRFSTPVTRAFIAEAIKAMAPRGQIRLFLLEIDSKIVASRLAFLVDSNLYLYYSGFDPAWRRLAVMTTLSIKIMQWAIANKVQVVNLSTGADLSKLRWKPEEVRFLETGQPAPGVRGKLALNAQSAMAFSSATLNHLRGYRSGSDSGPDSS